LGVSVNELLSGERLTDEQFRKQADENLVEAVRESSFSVKERTEFFKRKWLREHVWLFVVCALACVLLTYLLILRWDAAFLIFVPWFVAYCWLRNRMMAYVEGRVYGDPKPPTDG
ncbi:MAG: hypothetical protein K2M15_02765, partial [Oscillospiraceae bacterium]|nr:hypothetical protein [Oscillospiraceae bacterium]